jgi:hypothetical protein
VRIIRVNEKQCPRCGRGERSGYQYPDCANPPDGMTREEAHWLFCRNFGDEICADCYAERRRGWRGQDTPAE